MARIAEKPSVTEEKPTLAIEGAKKLLDLAAKSRAVAMELFASAREARTLVTKSERDVLAARRGAEHPEVQTIDARILADEAFVRTTRSAAKRAATPPAKAECDEWVLHGWVLGRHDEGKPDLTVALFQHGQRIPDLACDRTNADGYFRVALNERQFHGRPGQSAEKGHKDKVSPVSVRVLDANGACLADPPERFAPAVGTTDFLRVRLLDGATPPPSPKQTTPQDKAPGKPKKGK